MRLGSGGFKLQEIVTWESGLLVTYTELTMREGSIVSCQTELTVKLGGNFRN